MLFTCLYVYLSSVLYFEVILLPLWLLIVFGPFTDGSNKKGTSWVQDCLFRGNYQDAKPCDYITECRLKASSHYIYTWFEINVFQDIKRLFPPDHNPFYAGFGNRVTDEISYRKIGIPEGKIFLINPKVCFLDLIFLTIRVIFGFPLVLLNAYENLQGEVASSHRIDDVKSYTSLHTLVNDMFPPTSLVEQVRNLHKTYGLHSSDLTTKTFDDIISNYCRRILTHGIIGKWHCQILISS